LNMSYNNESHSYVIQEQITRTKYYIIYKAKNMLTGKLCMIKAIEPKWLSNVEVKTELRNQALLSSELKHPNICGVDTIFEEDNSLYVVWEYVDGQSLSSVLANQSISVNQSIEYTSQVLNALRYAHSLGILHKQLNLDSILITPEGTVKIIGFGKSNSAWMKVDGENSPFHPIYYIAPEIYHGESGIPNTDIYSLGVMLYMMLTKRLPWSVDYKQSFLQQKQQTFLKPVLDPELFGDRVPQWLYTIINRCLMLDPHLRIASPTELISALESEESYTYIPATNKSEIVIPTVDPIPDTPITPLEPEEIIPEPEQTMESPVETEVALEAIEVDEVPAEMPLEQPLDEITTVDEDFIEDVNNQVVEEEVEEEEPVQEIAEQQSVQEPIVEANTQIEDVPDVKPEEIQKEEPRYRISETIPKPIVSPPQRENPPQASKLYNPPVNTSASPQADDIEELSHMKKLFRLLAWTSAAILLFVVVKYFILNKSPQFNSVNGESTEQPSEAPSLEPNEPINMVSVAGDSTVIGNMDQEADPDEFPLRQVIIRPFSISVTEVTQKQWLMVNSVNPSQFLDDDNPVENVSFYDVIEYCNAKSVLDGFTPCYDYQGDLISCDFNANGYRLPTEAEWEYAAKAKKKDYFAQFSGSEIAGEVGWYVGNSSVSSHPVASLKPNEIGLYDMSGNVSEWVWDWYARYSYKMSDIFAGPDQGSDKVIRGGNWSTDAHEMRVTNRQFVKPFTKTNYIGFRVVRSMY